MAIYEKTNLYEEPPDPKKYLIPKGVKDEVLKSFFEDFVKSAVKDGTIKVFDETYGFNFLVHPHNTVDDVGRIYNEKLEKSKKKHTGKISEITDILTSSFNLESNTMTKEKEYKLPEDDVLKKTGVTPWLKDAKAKAINEKKKLVIRPKDNFTITVTPEPGNFSDRHGKPTGEININTPNEKIFR